MEASESGGDRNVVARWACSQQTGRKAEKLGVRFLYFCTNAKHAYAYTRTTSSSRGHAILVQPLAAHAYGEPGAWRWRHLPRRSCKGVVRVRDRTLQTSRGKICK